MPILSLDDVNLSYEQTGVGDDIVWIPGGDQRGMDFEEQFANFPDYRNTTYDPRGVGETTTNAPTPWTMTAMGRDCAELIRSVCKPPVVLTGLSMGSLIVQQVALDYPELVRLAIPMGTGGGGRSLFPGDWMQAEIAFRRQGGELSPEMALHHYAIFMYPPEVLGNSELWEQCRPVVESAYVNRNNDDLAAQWESCLTFDGFSRLGTCPVPIHVIGFSLDCQTPPTSGEAIAREAQDGHFHLLEGLGHMSLLRHKPLIVSAKIREIIETNTQH